MSHKNLRVLDAQQTASALPYHTLLQQLLIASQEYNEGKILTPKRQSVPYPNGSTLLSMPATADDIGVHKLVNIMPKNSQKGLGVIQGLVCGYDGQTGVPLFALDGVTVTQRRTAAVSLMGIALLWDEPKKVSIIGSGVQAAGHIEALHSLYPSAQIEVIVRDQQSAQKKLAAYTSIIQYSHTVSSDADVVITVTNSSTPVYNEPARKDRLLIAVGAYTPSMAEITASTVLQSTIFVDNKEGAQKEAGDLLQAKVDWDKVNTLSQPKPNYHTALLYKSVGCAAWDLAAVRCARLHA